MLPDRYYLGRFTRSPFQILAIILTIVFAAEVGIMLVLPLLGVGSLGRFANAVIDSLLLTLLIAPILWWIIIRPLRKIAIEQSERSATIVANASEGILTLTMDGTLLSSNPAAQSLLGYSDAEMRELPLVKIFPDYNASNLINVRSFPSIAIKKDQQAVPVEVSLSHLDNSNPPTIIAIIRDLTEAQRNEAIKIEQARQTEAMRAQQMSVLAEVATGVAHEIRNPLTSIKMLFQLHRQKLGSDGLPKDDLDIMEDEIRRMERSVTALLEYARPDQPQLEDFTLSEAVVRSLRLLEGRIDPQKVSIKRRLNANPIVHGDATQIQQLIINLCINALDAMPDGGELQIELTCEGDEAILWIRDKGRGIPDAVLQKLFSPFVTTKPNGVGLGLGICRRIAEAHQGHLIGENRAEGGAQFKLVLPVVRICSSKGRTPPSAKSETES